MALHYMGSSRKSKNKSRRRFDDEQIKLLETMFETEARPELRMKQQLANKLGLQPRQVAIWFQNKRARSKSKQIEGEYAVLKMSYDNLASKFESLKKENQTLHAQLQRLQKMTERSRDEECHQDKGNPIAENEDNSVEVQAYDNNKYEVDVPLCSDEMEKMEYLEEDDYVLNMVNIAENRYDFESIEFLEWE